MIQDAHDREQALDPSRSFIAGSGAGSGKTELIAQRFLSCLAVCDKPEEVLAITFTVKAQGEMRCRILDALRYANEHDEPDEAHRKTTYRLAKSVLQRDKELDWNIISHPNRLKIVTNDSFCSSITRQMPILSAFGSSPDVAENADALYAEAANNTVRHLYEEGSIADDIECLLLHLDNRWDRLVSMVADMLSQREQWLPTVMAGLQNTDNLQETLEQSLHTIVSSCLGVIYDSLSIAEMGRMDEVIGHAATQLCAEGDEIGEVLANIPEGEDIEAAYQYWKAFSKVLMTDEGNVRSRLTKAQGFLAPSAGKSKDEKDFLKAKKEEANDLFQDLGANSIFINSLRSLKDIPAIKYTESQWRIIESLIKLLPVAVAELKLSFERHGAVDFSEKSSRALMALKSIDGPTELQMLLDNVQRHILVDEFQDENIIQWELLKALTEGWEPDDGRSLFLVGDPMQSIYGFRQADVRLFLQAQEFGINDIELNKLHLSSNFRSSERIVDWVNDTFTDILPKENDLTKGAIAYRSSTAVIEPEEGDGVYMKGYRASNTVNRADETRDVVSLVQSHIQEHDDETIGILVRTKNHARDIIDGLREEGISYQTIDMQKLVDRPEVQDIYALARCLTRPSDKEAWLALLRSPLVGLTLKDIHHLFSQANKANSTLFSALRKSEYISDLEDKSLCVALASVLNAAFLERGRMAVREWVYGTWQLIRGDTYYCETVEKRNVEAFLEKLEANLNADGTLNVDTFNTVLDGLTAAIDEKGDPRVQILTIHKSKGLEFHTVVLPGLDRKSRGDTSSLMTYTTSGLGGDHYDMLMAPVKKALDVHDPLYNYVNSLKKERNLLELSRLLYVAATRARKKLYMFAYAIEKEDGDLLAPEANSLLGRMWVYYEATAEWCQVERRSDYDSVHVESITRIKEPLTELTKAVSHASNDVVRDESDPHGKLRGVVVHEALRQAGQYSVAQSQLPIQFNIDYFYGKLLELGLRPIEARRESEVCIRSMQRMSSSQTAKWLLESKSFKRCEYGLTANIDGSVKNIRLDLYFVENGVAWVIDYKTDMPAENQTAEEFFATVMQKHKEQLEAYRKIVEHLHNGEIKTAVYLPYYDKLLEMAA